MPPPPITPASPHHAGQRRGGGGRVCDACSGSIDGRGPTKYHAQLVARFSGRLRDVDDMSATVFAPQRVVVQQAAALGILVMETVAALGLQVNAG